MALFDLYDSGGTDHLGAAGDGVGWIKKHPEVEESLVDKASGAIWRKVGRRDPAKAVRRARALSSALSPRLKLAPLDRIFPPMTIDYECRPYELGWMNYTWRSNSLVRAPSESGIGLMRFRGK
jgi:hypothetical protein